MIIYSAGRKYTTTLSGQRVKYVQCERCRAEYVYILKREAKGTGTSALWLDNSGAAQRSAEEAEKELERVLRTEVEVVPCPDCGWLQRDMVSDAKSSKLMGWVLLGILLGVVGIIFTVATDNRYGPEHPYLLSLGLLVAIPLLASIPIYFFWDPNKKADERKGVIDPRAIRRAEFERQHAEQAASAPPPIIAPAAPPIVPAFAPPMPLPSAGPPPLGAQTRSMPPPLPPRG